MTQLELKEHFRDKLIPHYKLAIERCRGNWYKEAISICKEMVVGLGVCNCSKYYFNTSIDLNEIIGDGYWFNPVFEATSTTEIIDLLQKRVDKMESIVNS